MNCTRVALVSAFTLAVAVPLGAADEVSLEARARARSSPPPLVPAASPA